MFDNEVFLDICFLELALLLLRAQHRKVVTVSEHRNSRFGRMVQTM